MLGDINRLRAGRRDNFEHHIMQARAIRSSLWAASLAAPGGVENLIWGEQLAWRKDIYIARLPGGGKAKNDRGRGQRHLQIAL